MATVKAEKMVKHVGVEFDGEFVDLNVLLEICQKRRYNEFLDVPYKANQVMRKKGYVTTMGDGTDSLRKLLVRLYGRNIAKEWE